MDKILHHPRNPRMMILLQIPKMVSHGSKWCEMDFVLCLFCEVGAFVLWFKWKPQGNPASMVAVDLPILLTVVHIMVFGGFLKEKVPRKRMRKLSDLGPLLNWAVYLGSVW